MTYKIPPLNALRAFEATARHLSFKGASGELHVTPGAVSQQVKSLEDVLGVGLFERIHNGLILTEEGQRYLAPIRSAFTSISAATQMISPRETGSDLTIATDPDFAVKWLIPKIPAFQAALPELRVRIANATTPDDIVSGRFDIGLLPGISSFQGLACEPLLSESLVPACAPHLQPIVTARVEQAKILTYGDEATWSIWLDRYGAGPPASFEQVAFDDKDLALYAAVNGNGLAMVSTVFDTEYLISGKLAAPFGVSVETGLDYHVLVPAGRVDCPTERRFLDWIRSQTKTVS